VKAGGNAYGGKVTAQIGGSIRDQRLTIVPSACLALLLTPQSLPLSSSGASHILLIANNEVYFFFLTVGAEPFYEDKTVHT
jgi:hypothetical protein